MSDSTGDKFLDSMAMQSSSGIKSVRDHAREVLAVIAERNALKARADYAGTLEKKLERVMIGGNHLTSILVDRLGLDFATSFPPTMDHDDALEELGATMIYDVWCCWRAIMCARDDLAPPSQVSASGAFCVYCGFETPFDLAPDDAAARIIDHHKTCQKGPEARLRQSTNYTANAEIDPTRVVFANGRTVEVVDGHLVIGFESPVQHRSDCEGCKGSGEEVVHDTTQGPNGDEYTVTCHLCMGTGFASPAKDHAK